MQRYLNDPKWKSANRKCCFLSLIPVLGFFGLIFMGKKSGRKQYRNLGVTYGILSGACFLACLTAIFINRIHWGVGYDFLYRLEDNLQLYGALGLFLLWPVCLIHTFVRSGEYLKYLALHSLSAPRRSPLTAISDWRMQNSSWMIWAYLPSLSGLSLIFAGRQLRKQGLTAFGILSMVISWGFTLAETITDRLCSFAISTALGAIGTWLTIILWIGITIYVFLIREDYLDARASVWTAETSRYNVLLDDKWRRANSRWQIWTFFPYLGGIGVFIAGVKSRTKRTTFLGAFLILLTFAFMLTSVLLNNAYYDEVVFSDAADAYRAAMDALWPISIAGYCLIIFAGCFVLWETLVAKAANLQGYSSEFERELDLYNRRQVQSAAPAVVSAPVTPKPAKKAKSKTSAKPADAPAPAAPPAASGANPIDINTCTMDALMTLPGIGIAQAKHAMQYRAQQGGFRSVDEFVELLQIKPHFAVQILSRATVAAPSQTESHPEAGALRRRIDF